MVNIPDSTPDVIAVSEPVLDIENKDAIIELLKRDAKRLGCRPEELRCRVVMDAKSGQAQLEVERIPDGEEEKDQKDQKHSEHCTLDKVFRREVSG